MRALGFRTLLQACKCSECWSAPCSRHSWQTGKIEPFRSTAVVEDAILTPLLRYGRKLTYIGLCLMMAAGQGVSAIAPSAFVYAFGRFLCGAGLAGEKGLKSSLACKSCG